MVPKSVRLGITLRLPVEVVIEVAPPEADPAFPGNTTSPPSKPDTT